MRLLGLLALTGLVAAIGCGDSFGRGHDGRRLLVRVVGGNRGTPETRLPISFLAPQTFTVEVEALTPEGRRDASFNGFVRLSSKPGAVRYLGGDAAAGRNVRLQGGLAQGIEVPLVAAYGDTRLWAEDVGYVPVDPNRTPGPQCADGKDNNGNGVADSPLDPGCTFPNDDDENGGSFAAGVSEVLYFQRPRIADVRGLESGGAETPFRSEQVSVDVGAPIAPRSGGVVVTRISSNGFYMTDLDDNRGPTSIYSFTFSAPQGLRVCDRLKSLTGTATAFFGMTQLSSPTWTVEYFRDIEVDPERGRDCLVPEPHSLTLDELGSAEALFRNEAALVRVASLRNDAGEWTRVLRIARKFGPGSPSGPDFLPQADATNCDLNRDGRVNFDPGTDEATCDTACKNDGHCSEFSNFLAQSNFRVVLEDLATPAPDAALADPERLLAVRRAAVVQVNASTSARFDPVLMRGKPLYWFTGTLDYFSGGSQFTIEARCSDDLVVEPGTELPWKKTCVRVRDYADNNESLN